GGAGAPGLRQHPDPPRGLEAPATDIRPFGLVHDVLDVNLGYIRQMIDEHMVAGGLQPASGTARHVRPRDHSQRLFMLCSLAIWARSPEHDRSNA
ncbi:MAG: hypothetical protein AAGI30_14145, partial [Planctomycetota bacterium]